MLVKIVTDDFTLSTARRYSCCLPMAGTKPLPIGIIFMGFMKTLAFLKVGFKPFTLNNGEVWSAYFGELYAVGKFSKNNYAIPLNVWIQWDKDKIKRQVDMLDSKFITAEIEAQANS